MNALSPLDDRYAYAMKSLAPIFSEFGLVKRRLKVEVEYLIWLLPIVTHMATDKNVVRRLRAIVENFDETDYKKIKEYETQCHHDVKAVEYYLADTLAKVGFSKYTQWVHFGLTSEDINNIAQTMQLREGSQVLLQTLAHMQEKLALLIEEGSEAVMLARTHGQPAVPTTMGRELMVHALALTETAESIAAHQYRGKIGGAVGTRAAHYATFPEIDWEGLVPQFLAQFALTPEPVNTQVLAPNSWVRLFNLWSQIALLVEGLAKDLWWYVALDYFDQGIVKGQVGSSTMPQKVNPIQLENSEGNARLAYTLMEHFCQVFSYSRLQRDLSDSTVRRNFGVAYGHLLLALKSLASGLESLSLNQEVMGRELENHYEVLGEAVQTHFRKMGEAGGYEKVKLVTQGSTMTRKSYLAWVKSLELPTELQTQLTDLTPQTYSGNAKIQVTKLLPVLRQRIKQLSRGAS